MYIEIRRAGFVNKGAELMLAAIVEKIQARYPDCKFVMAPDNYAQPYEKIIKNGFYLKGELYKKGLDFSWLFKFIPRKIRNVYGIVLNDDIDVVLDAAGFFYSDQWGGFSCIELAVKLRSWKRNNIVTILLPQAFGPFESKFNKLAMKYVLRNSDLIYPRENQSKSYLEALGGQSRSLEVYPDFTNLISGTLPANFKLANNSVCLIPNYRMIDMTNSEASSGYIDFMASVANYLIKQGKSPFVLIHEGAKDMELGKSISELSMNLPVIFESEPRNIKGIIGRCEFVVGSRFHGLVSALSQGVPALATGWSHKYEMLFSDYDFPEGILSIDDPEEAILEKLDLLIDVDSRERICSKIRSKSNYLKELSESMWKEVFSIIDSKVQ